ncbi:hypothetical protein [Streptomyces erythrochromogenes]|uniref:hypothetical protein n=1 Tax=Streptomyces erythrochromogenes TaxID=285574 RepID=UPI0036893C4F
MAVLPPRERDGPAELAAGSADRWAEAGERHYDMLKNPSLPEPVLAAIAASSDTSYAGQALWMLEVRALRAGTETPC